MKGLMVAEVPRWQSSHRLNSIQYHEPFQTLNRQNNVISDFNMLPVAQELCEHCT